MTATLSNMTQKFLEMTSSTLAEWSHYGEKISFTKWSRGLGQKGVIFNLATELDTPFTDVTQTSALDWSSYWTDSNMKTLQIRLII